METHTEPAWQAAQARCDPSRESVKYGNDYEKKYRERDKITAEILSAVIEFHKSGICISVCSINLHSVMRASLHIGLNTPRTGARRICHHPTGAHAGRSEGLQVWRLQHADVLRCPSAAAYAGDDGPHAAVDGNMVSC